MVLGGSRQKLVVFSVLKFSWWFLQFLAVLVCSCWLLLVLGGFWLFVVVLGGLFVVFADS